MQNNEVAPLFRKTTGALLYLSDCRKYFFAFLTLINDWTSSLIPSYLSNHRTLLALEGWNFKLSESVILTAVPAFPYLARSRSFGAVGATLTSLALLITLCLALCTQPAVAGCKRKRGDTRVSVPIFLATDRVRIIDSPSATLPASPLDVNFDFGKQIIEPINAMTYGLTRESSYCSVSDDLRPSLVKSGWYFYPADGKGTANDGAQVAEEFRPKIFEAGGFDQFCKELKAALDVAARREIVIYVHGCCIDYRGSVRQAADLASSVKAPVVAYSWGCSNGYSGSTLAYPRTQERFNNFMIDMLKAFPNEHITLVGSSIGNNILINFCLQRRPVDYGSRQINELILSRADIDDIAFKSQLEHVRQHAKKIILYVAKNDFQINLSGTLRWFFYPTQHGERAGHLRAMLYTEPSLTVLDVSPLNLGHLIPYDSIDDLLQNGGRVPKDSTSYHYVHENSNLYRVKPQRTMRERTASRLDHD